jgi:hypothetical protein
MKSEQIQSDVSSLGAERFLLKSNIRVSKPEGTYFDELFLRSLRPYTINAITVETFRH